MSTKRSKKRRKRREIPQQISRETSNAANRLPCTSIKALDGYLEKAGRFLKKSIPLKNERQRDLPSLANVSPSRGAIPVAPSWSFVEQASQHRKSCCASKAPRRKSSGRKANCKLHPWSRYTCVGRCKYDPRG